MQWTKTDSVQNERHTTTPIGQIGLDKTKMPERHAYSVTVLSKKPASPFNKLHELAAMMILAVEESRFPVSKVRNTSSNAENLDPYAAYGPKCNMGSLNHSANRLPTLVKFQ